MKYKEQNSMLLQAARDLIQQADLNLEWTYQSPAFKKLKSHVQAMPERDWTIEYNEVIDEDALIETGQRVIREIEEHDPHDAIGHRFINNVAFLNFRNIIRGIRPGYMLPEESPRHA
jgi:hypothetical protein